MFLETQGHRLQLPQRYPLVYVEALAVAPRNRWCLEDPPYLRGVGRTLLLFARQRSLELGVGFDDIYAIARRLIRHHLAKPTETQLATIDTLLAGSVEPGNMNPSTGKQAVSLLAEMFTRLLAGNGRSRIAHHLITGVECRKNIASHNGGINLKTLEFILFN